MEKHSDGDDANKTVINLKGSVTIVSDFFFTAINSILYQRGTFCRTSTSIRQTKENNQQSALFCAKNCVRPEFIGVLFIVLLTLWPSTLLTGIYMPETFKREVKYGLTCLTTTDEGLLRYLRNVQKQVTEWLLTGNIQRLVVVVKGVDTMETLERWQFNVLVDDAASGSSGENVSPNQPPVASTKSIKDIHNEIQAIIRQITASVTFLPLLQEPCTFDLLVYTDKDVAAPEKWADSDPCYILNSAEVKLRSFTTTVHKVDSMVAYKEPEEWEL